ncbi:MAG TPA: pantoate--beta-alanine ligase [Aquella sp.]|nr:pantoate--beta-alanine ligase [Aquella sp.]
MRPGHFQGVCTIICKLFNIVQPTHAYFGQKDIQQIKIIEKLTDDLNFPVDIVTCPTVRDYDGLALSSRNSYLQKNERETAKIIPETLNYIKEQFQNGIRASSKLIELATDKITNIKDARIAYIQIVDATNLQPVATIDKKCVLAVAIFIGKTRLTDNIILTV